jgi:hypothetical protein
MVFLFHHSHSISVNSTKNLKILILPLPFCFPPSAHIIPSYHGHIYYYFSKSVHVFLQFMA